MTETPRLLVTGSRNWTDRETIRDELSRAWKHLGASEDTILVHGACPSGADAIADQVWRGWGLPVEAHPAQWRKHGRRAGPIRNTEMVRAGADLVLAFPVGASPGTRGCIRTARKAGLNVQVIEG